MPTPLRRRVVLVGMCGVSLAAAAAIARPLVTPDAPPPVASLEAPHDSDDPLFTAVFLPPGTWTTAAADPDPELARLVREKVGGGTILDVTPQPAATAHLPVPAGATPQLIRVDTTGRANAVLTTPIHPDAAAAAWAAAGWAATDRPLGGGRRVVRIIRGGVTALAWALPAGPTTTDIRFLIALSGGPTR